ncbi:unnamed protein product [Ambrosiozyma monospora]|uniref:Unnamed protein product n=1 Tax=Ambrosiozyma monospora TaxID=43982 RepID=A0ACB5TXY3_AMBMO|nr:unnamed protein product [Ambrosiozyma monospora]
MGKVKQVHYDPKSNSTKLVEMWCSKAEAGQRRGRAGRIRNGYCYKMFTREVENEVMLKYPIPEIKRTKLESVYLIVKSMGISNVFEFLKLGLDPPSITNVSNAKFALSEIGALNQHDGLTNLGGYLSMIPTDLRSGKLMIYGTLFGCLESCLTLAAVSTTGSPFMTRRAESRDDVKKVQNEFAQGQGDAIAILNAFNQYNDEDFGGARNRKRWLDDHYLSYLTMSDIQSTRVQYISILKELGFIPYSYSSSKATEKEFAKFNRNCNNFAILKSLLTSSSYPQIARVQYPNPKYLASASGSVALDPDLKKVKLWIRNEEFMKMKLDPSSALNQPRTVDQKFKFKDDKNMPLPATRAFLHPSSTLFNTDNNDDISQDEITTDENGNYIFTPTVAALLA